jgi:hypothetical protein
VARTDVKRLTDAVDSRAQLRIYSSRWPLSGRHENRPPQLQPDPDVRESDVVADYQRALAAGDTDAIVASFEPDGYAREPAGGPASTMTLIPPARCEQVARYGSCWMMSSSSARL